MPVGLALLFSAAIHFVGLTMPGWYLPGDAESPQPLVAHLLPPPAPAVAPPSPSATHPPVKQQHKSAARKTTPVVKENAAVAPILAAEPAEDLNTVSTVAEPATHAGANSATPVQASSSIPSRGRIRYVGIYGEAHFMIGDMTIEWTLENEHYRIMSQAAPRGLAALFGRARQQLSVGDITAQGLRPSEYSDQLLGSKKETVTFNWQTQKAYLSRAATSAPLTAGVLDPVTVFFQLAWLQPRQNVTLNVATTKQITPWVFEFMGEETLTPMTIAAGSHETDLNTKAPERAPIQTLHLRSVADGDTTDIWLAPEQGGLPAKIRIKTRQGKQYEMLSDPLQNTLEPTP